MTANLRLIENTPSQSSVDTRICALTPDQVMEVWELICDFFAYVPSCSGGGNDVPSVLELALEGRSVIWVVTQEGIPMGAFATEIREYPRMKVCALWAAGGDWLAMTNHWTDLDEYARLNDCEVIHSEIPPTLQSALANARNPLHRAALREAGTLVRVVLERRP